MKFIRYIGVQCSKCGVDVVMWRDVRYADGKLTKSKVLQLAKPYFEKHECRGEA